MGKPSKKKTTQLNSYEHTSIGQKNKLRSDLKAMYVNDANGAVHFQRGQRLIDLYQQPIKEQGVQSLGNTIPECKGKRGGRKCHYRDEKPTSNKKRRRSNEGYLASIALSTDKGVAIQS